jgi:hypothetical protein
MTKIAEYSEVNSSNKSQRTILAGKPSTKYPGTHYSLVHATAGYEPAGACARWTEEKYGTLFLEPRGGQGGQWYKTKAEAEAHFNRVTN